MAEAVIPGAFHLSSADPKAAGLDTVRRIGPTRSDMADRPSQLWTESIHSDAARLPRRAEVARLGRASAPDDPGTPPGPECGAPVQRAMAAGLALRLSDMIGSEEP